jgi:hypothetical protein
MLTWFRELDELLRGRKTLASELAEGRLALALRMFVPIAIGLGAIYGLSMGAFAVINRSPPNLWQMFASTVKLPALFLLTLAVTFPSLYVFNALVGCRLSWGTTLRLLVGAVAVNLAVAASLGPILAFFTVSTTSYPFMILLNVIFLALSGLVGLSFLLGVLRRTAHWQAESAQPPRPTSPPQQPAEPASLASYAISEEQPPPRPISRTPARDDDSLGNARLIFQIWVLIYGLVGAQMGWLLRPFVGHPDMPFQWFRERSGNFFQALANVLQKLLG